MLVALSYLSLSSALLLWSSPVVSSLAALHTYDHKLLSGCWGCPDHGHKLALAVVEADAAVPATTNEGHATEILDRY